MRRLCFFHALREENLPLSLLSIIKKAENAFLENKFVEFQVHCVGLLGCESDVVSQGKDSLPKVN